MNNHLQSDSTIMLDRYRGGPLEPHLVSFANWLSEAGYLRHNGMQKLRIFAS